MSFVTKTFQYKTAAWQGQVKITRFLRVRQAAVPDRTVVSVVRVSPSASQPSWSERSSGQREVKDAVSSRQSPAGSTTHKIHQHTRAQTSSRSHTNCSSVRLLLLIAGGTLTVGTLTALCTVQTANTCSPKRWTWPSTPLMTEIIMLMLTARLALLGSPCQRFSREPRHSAKCQPPPGECVSVCADAC